MLQIKIIKLPPGVVPKKFRRAWLNEKFDVIESFETSHQIDAQKAVEQLRTNGKKAAANFWQRLAGTGTFGFPKAVCREI